MDILCCAFGHRELYYNIEEALKSVIETLIMKKSVNVFMTGGMGESDALFAKIIRTMKKSYPHIKLILVKPYFSNELNTHKEYYDEFFDLVIIPEESAVCHYKSAISQRNKWIADCCEYVIDCTHKDFGGAYDAVSYAREKGKNIIKIMF